MPYIVEIEKGVFLAPWEGDPGRTLVQNSAKVYESKSRATIELKYAQKMRPFVNAKVIELEYCTPNERAFLDEIREKGIYADGVFPMIIVGNEGDEYPTRIWQYDFPKSDLSLLVEKKG